VEPVVSVASSATRAGPVHCVPARCEKQSHRGCHISHSVLVSLFLFAMPSGCTVVVWRSCHSALFGLPSRGSAPPPPAACDLRRDDLRFPSASLGKTYLRSAAPGRRLTDLARQRTDCNRWTRGRVRVGIEGMIVVVKSCCWSSDL